MVLLDRWQIFIIQIEIELFIDKIVIVLRSRAFHLLWFFLVLRARMAATPRLT